MNARHARRRQHGFSMLEVLIAVMVFSFGVLGLAGLLIFAIQSNHVAYLRTQATFLAHNMATRMGANPVGIWNGEYNITEIAPASTAGTQLVTCAAGCSPADLATHDIQSWSQQLRTFLPDASGNITCSGNGLTYTPTAQQVGNRPPYGGICSMTLGWNEAGSGSDSSRRKHSFEWVFQP